MKHKIGSQVRRGIILKSRQKLKALLAEHEVKAGDVAHSIILLELCSKVKCENDKFSTVEDPPLDHAS